ncbi:VF530 family DNA-binding protein [Sandaracinus amylolyticus]|nr:VF530 family protein [Sandaracinus amylolyticus]
MTSSERPRDPLHGVTLAMMLERLVDELGWDAMGRAVDIRCFTHEPSIASSLKFLRRTPWARAKVEALYLDVLAARRSRPRS